MGKRRHQPLDEVSVHHLRSSIKAFERINLETSPQRVVSDQMRRILRMYPWSVVPHDIHAVFRGRPNEGDVSFEHVSELWYNKNSDQIGPGRLNDAGQPVFYCASEVDTAIFELRPKANTKITVLIVRGKKCRLRIDGSFLGATLSRNHLVLQNRPIIDRTKFELLANIGKSNARKVTMVDGFIGQHLIKTVRSAERHLYKPTIAIADFLFGSAKIPLLSYPSVATAAEGVNYAFPAHIADEWLEPHEAWEFQIHGTRLASDGTVDGYVFSPLRRSRKIADTGSIDWAEETPEQIMSSFQHMLALPGGDQMDRVGRYVYIHRPDGPP